MGCSDNIVVSRESHQVIWDAHSSGHEKVPCFPKSIDELFCFQHPFASSSFIPFLHFPPYLVEPFVSSQDLCFSLYLQLFELS